MRILNKNIPAPFFEDKEENEINVAIYNYWTDDEKDIVFTRVLCFGTM